MTRMELNAELGLCESERDDSRSWGQAVDYAEEGKLPKNRPSRTFAVHTGLIKGFQKGAKVLPWNSTI